jgi:hypothetical protein
MRRIPYDPTMQQQTTSVRQTPPADPNYRGDYLGPIRPGLANPYRLASSYMAAAPEVRVHRSPTMVSDYKRIAALDPLIGRKLDALGANLREVLWVAGCADAKYVVQREARFKALVTLLETYKSEAHGRRFNELARSMPKVGRAATKERNLAAAVPTTRAPGPTSKFR